MNRNSVFNQTRRRLAAWYAGVIGIILAMSGLSIYFLIDWFHWQGFHQELQSVAGTLHDGLEPQLKRPGQVEPEVEQLLPGLCFEGETCDRATSHADIERHILGVVHQENYYVRLLDLSGRIVAILEYRPLDLPVRIRPLWQTLEDPSGDRYHQISLGLKTAAGTPWGYIQVGRALEDFDRHLALTRWVLLTGLPFVLSLTTLASWWLAGRAMRPVYRSYQQIQQFTADAAHELRTPLAASRATLEVALQTPDISDAEARDTLQTLERQNARLSRLVGDLLLLSRMDIQEGVREPKPCCLDDIVSDLLEEYAGLAIAANVSLRFEKDGDRPVYVSGDETGLYRLLANLVTNAIGYTPEGGKVTIELTRDERHAIVRVRDTGIGIATAEQARVFDRFYRVNSDRSRQTGGSGLGLAIARTIAVAHRGTLQVWSEPGEGSLFTLRLPHLGERV